MMQDSGDLTLAGDTAEGMPSFSAHERGPGLQRGDRLGRYTVLELLGHGGMGLVYAAYDPQLDRRVAVKVLRARGTRGATERAQQRLLREAQAMAKLSHPNVVAVHDVGTFVDEVFIAMEFVDGASLDRWLKERPRAWHEVVAVFADAGRGLEAAHAVGLVHRDFKPQNVLIDRTGRARVTDFGLAQIGDPSSMGSIELVSGEMSGPSLLLTEGDALIGTPAYMAPEQHARIGVDARTDQFGFCVALYEALYGRHPFAGETLVELASSVSRGKLREPPGDSDVPAHVRRAVMRGLAREPEARWPDMSTLLAALLDDPARRHRRWLGVAAVVAAIAGVVALSTRRAPVAAAPPPCEGAGDDVDAVWTPARRDAIEEAFATTRQPHAATVWSRSTEVLDEYAVRWRGSARDACEATRVRGEQSDSLFDLRRACLDRRLHELDVRLELLEQVDAEMVDRGFDVATSLTPIDVCEDARRLTELVPLPEDPARVQQVRVLREKLASLEASFIAGRVTTVAKQLEPLMQQGIALDYTPVRAEVRWLASRVREDLGHWKDAEALLWEAVVDAGEAHDDRFLAGILVTTPHLVGYLQTRFADAELLAPTIRAALARVGRPDDLVARFEQHMGSMRLRQGDRRSARVHYLDALTRFHEGEGNARQRSTTLNNLGVVEMLDGNYDAARSRFVESHAERKGLLRPDSPENIDHHQNLANLAFAQSDFSLALDEVDRALELIRSNRSQDGPQELLALLLRAQALTSLHRFGEARADVDQALLVSAKLHGPDHAQGFGYAAWFALARLEREVGNLDAARTAIVRSIELSRTVLGEDNYELAQLLWEHAALELRAGDLDLAARQITEALRLGETGYGPEHPQTAVTLRLLGSIDLARGALPAAREQLERAVELLERRHGDAQELARGRFDLARCLPQADHARARRLAEQARERLFIDGATTEVAAIDAWLAGPPP